VVGVTSILAPFGSPNNTITSSSFTTFSDSKSISIVLPELCGAFDKGLYPIIAY